MHVCRQGPLSGNSDMQYVIFSRLRLFLASFSYSFMRVAIPFLRQQLRQIRHMAVHRRQFFTRAISILRNIPASTPLFYRFCLPLLLFSRNP